MSMVHLLTRHADRAALLFFQAGEIAAAIRFMDSALESLCLRSCPDCDDPCCIRANVRYDFGDLVFLQCAGNGLPLMQAVSGTGGGCAMLGPYGCILPRMLRPFMCTWYLCPVQTAILRSALNPVSRLPVRLKEIQHRRKKLESAFLGLVSPAKERAPR